jgi:ABC-type lipoprotein export system ATPase subunit
MSGPAPTDPGYRTPVPGSSAAVEAIHNPKSKTQNERPLLTLTSVAKSYAPTDATEAMPVLRDVNLWLGAGEAVAIVGPSGSGKSTLLNIIGTLDRPDRGSVRLGGRELTTLTEQELAAVRCREIGLVFQLHHLLPQCTVLENVLVPTLALPAKATRQGEGATERQSEQSTSHGRPHRPFAERSEERARRLLERVGLTPRLAHRPGQLSGGERQRVAVVRALINEPKLLLADEPTGALDRAAAENLAQLLMELNREEGVSLIVVTHARSLARQMGRVLALRNGALVEGADAEDGHE